MHFWCGVLELRHGEFVAVNFFSGGFGANEGGERASERKKTTQRPRSPIFRRGGVTGALSAVSARVGRIACSRATLWLRVWACVSNTWRGHKIAKDTRIFCSGVREI